jgi:hypothetical protein
MAVDSETSFPYVVRRSMETRENLFAKETAVKRQLLIFCAIWLSLAGSGFGQTETKVKVVGQRVNLRAKADLQAEVVGQIADGEFLNARSFQDDWVEVAPPDTVELWVHREFVKDNQVMAPKLYVRGGPGINYTVVGTLLRGDTITPKGDFGEWIKIVPPAVCSLWVNRSYVQVLQPEKSRPVPAQRPAADPSVKAGGQVVEGAAEAPDIYTPPVVAVAPKTPVAQPVQQQAATNAPSDLALIPLAGQGRAVQRDGILRLSGLVWGRPSRFRLVRYEGSRIEMICYVRGNSSQMNALLGQRLLIRGREYWVQGVKYPVVMPDEIIPRASE